MILTTIEYDPDWFEMSDAEIYEILQTLSENVEAITGLVFSEELDHVDVRIRPFGNVDQYDTPLFITIDVEEKEMTRSPRDLADQFGVHFNTQLTSITGINIPFRLWVRQIVGAYHESP